MINFKAVMAQMWPGCDTLGCTANNMLCPTATTGQLLRMPAQQALLHGLDRRYQTMHVMECRIGRILEVLACKATVVVVIVEQS